MCPSELQVISAALDKLGDDGRDIQPLFVTIDPARDTPEVVAQYVKNFHPRFVGLTGSAAEVAAMAKAYRVFYGKAEGSGTTDYLMDHSSIVYLMDREGRFLKHFGYSMVRKGSPAASRRRRRGDKRRSPRTGLRRDPESRQCRLEGRAA